MADVLSREHPLWPEFCARHEDHFFRDLAPDATGDDEARHIVRRCNGHEHRAEDGRVVPSDPGAAFSATIAILAALELDIPGSLAWLRSKGGGCDCEVGLNVIAGELDDEDEVPA